MTVENILNKLDIPFKDVQLGKANLHRSLSSIEQHELQKEFEKVGFEIVQDRNEKMINQIKSTIIDEVYSNDPSNKKLSEILTQKLNYDYSHITHLFTEKEGQSIQKFYNAVRTERVKELIDNDEYSLAAIADLLGYSTPAYLSTSFKKATGYTPSEYKSLKLNDRNSLDAV
ncbi:AraC family transcriptional regulator [Gramella jeungdoensis]|uniref:AraC family transcriptional regulator n=1 Tax=Gramella jeungdoensis TaxID=708091 RepID=A0ABT0Z6H3_9FLAO|nr:AraC family transcriptional regulator [Gramella jeungdoensis]MCM8571015.1 AraC family transcriptional regulator [Gramella jeungdoensis]